MERPTETDARPVSVLWIIGTLSLILGLAGGAAFLMVPRGSSLDAAETVGEFFAKVAEPLPHGLVAQEARRLPSRELLLTYGLPAGAEAGAADDPIELTLMQFPAQRAETVLEDQFQKLRFESGGGGRGGRGGGRSRGGGRGGPNGYGGKNSNGPPKPKLQDAGFLDWQGFSANYARLRHGGSKDDKGAKSKPSGYDTVRVNLSTGGRCIIAYVKFPEGTTGSKEAVGELLSSFEPLPAATQQ